MRYNFNNLNFTGNTLAGISKKYDDHSCEFDCDFIKVYGICLMIQNKQIVHWMTPGERSSRPATAGSPQRGPFTNGIR